MSAERGRRSSTSAWWLLLPVLSVVLVSVAVVTKTRGERTLVLMAGRRDETVDLVTSFADASWQCFSCDHVTINETLTLVPSPSRDYWQRTFYSPLLRKDDAPRFTAPVAAGVEASLEVAFSLEHAAQFDQAGALIRVDEGHWVKAGIEVVDGVPRLSVVVTSGFSDWSTQPWPDSSLKVRLHKLLPGPEQGPAVVVEAASFDDSSDDEWHLVRIASLRPPPNVPWRLGVFAAAPVAQLGCRATFHSIRLGPKLPIVHDTDPGHS
mmetsp:Transcript_15255/g.46229  ORF Transcript_15255/g.46229 Transcript_15255/m.46229 type:complete len:265 (+) Transcript_15255:26-820(+)